MEVANGCSTEFGKWKASVNLEEAEFYALCLEHGLDPLSFSVNQKFLFMWDATEVLLGIAKAASGQWPNGIAVREKAVAMQKAHIESFKQIWSKGKE